MFAIDRVFTPVIERHRLDAQSRQILLTSLVDETVDQMVGDPDRVEQVIENLVAKIDAVTAEDIAVLAERLFKGRSPALGAVGQLSQLASYETIRAQFA